MQEAELRFEREELNGVIPVGTYLYDAARRMGVDVECERTGESDECVMKVTHGGEYLSEVTEAEIKQLSEERRRQGERLACQVKIERAEGEIVIMTTEKKEEVKPDYEVRREAYRKEFEELPLEKKIASLVELEAIALGDTFSFIVNSPYKLVGKFMDILAEFGLKMDEEVKKQTRPKEHQPDEPPSVKEETGDNEEPSVTEDIVDAIDNEPSVTGESTSKKTSRGKKTEPPTPSV